MKKIVLAIMFLFISSALVSPICYAAEKSNALVDKYTDVDGVIEWVWEPTHTHNPYVAVYYKVFVSVDEQPFYLVATTQKPYFAFLGEKGCSYRMRIQAIGHYPSYFSFEWLSKKTFRIIFSPIEELIPSDFSETSELVKCVGIESTVVNINKEFIKVIKVSSIASNLLDQSFFTHLLLGFE